MAKQRTRIRFAICVDDDGYDDLESWKVYRILADGKATQVGCLRVVDDSGEDYLYPEERFVVLELPKKVQDRLLVKARA